MRDEVWNKLAEARGHANIESYLRTAYVEQQHSMFAIATELECNPGTIRQMLDRFDIEVRPRKEVPKIPVKELRNLPYGELMKRYKVGRTTLIKMKKALKIHS